jgi:hypothetical protein
MTPLRELTIQPSLIDIIKRETGEAAWSGPGFGLIGIDGQRLFVYNTPAVQQRVAETIGRFQRPETKNVQFVMDVRFLTFSASFFERIGLAFSVKWKTQADTPLDHPKLNTSVTLQGAKETRLNDVRVTIFQYLHPILGPDGNSICKQPGVSAYWIAKDDIPKVQEIGNISLNAVAGDTRSSASQSKVVTFNGQPSVTRETIASQSFTTDIVPNREGNDYRPVQTEFAEGETYAMFSLLSWDGKTVSSDVHYEAAILRRLNSQEMKGDDELWLEVPQIDRITISEKNLIWPADGMLVVVIGGIHRLSERRYETPRPIIGKIPFLDKRLTTKENFGRELCTINGILTVRMLAPNETP